MEDLNSHYEHTTFGKRKSGRTLFYTSQEAMIYKGNLVAGVDSTIGKHLEKEAYAQILPKEIDGYVKRLRSIGQLLYNNQTLGEADLQALREGFHYIGLFESSQEQQTRAEQMGVATGQIGSAVQTMASSSEELSILI